MSPPNKDNKPDEKPESIINVNDDNTNAVEKMEACPCQVHVGPSTSQQQTCLSCFELIQARCKEQKSKPKSIEVRNFLIKFECLT